MSRIGVVQFPGSNCDQDCIDALGRHFDIKVQAVWHTETTLPKLDGLIVPGGFSFGDYLRSGCLAAHSPIMQEIKAFAKNGGSVIGICNGFQILTESRLLPGTLLKNQSRQFICKPVYLKSVQGDSVYHKKLAGKVMQVPIAHGEGRYFAEPEDLKKLWDRGQVVLQYTTKTGELADTANPNGSFDAIAGIISENGKVFGLMPHPERATDKLLGGSDQGLAILHAFLAST